ncbi:MAG: hypothetical protein AB7F82_09310 [Alphaproteobacteria bacterium]
MRKILFTSVAIIIFTSQAHATKIVADSNCKLVETVTVGVNINNVMVNTIADAKAQFDKKSAEVTDVAGELKIDSHQMQSANYNIYAQGNGSYNMSGSFQYKMPSSEMAFKFATTLEKKGLTPSINSNSYRQGNCN